MVFLEKDKKALFVYCLGVIGRGGLRLGICFEIWRVWNIELINLNLAYSYQDSYSFRGSLL